MPLQDSILHEDFEMLNKYAAEVIYLQNQSAQFSQLERSNFKMFTYRLNLIKFHG